MGINMRISRKAGKAMRNTGKKIIWLFTTSLVVLMLVGCKTAPRWDWWRVGQHGTADSSEVARSADVALPSVVAAYEEGTVSDTSPAGTVADGGGVAPAFDPWARSPSASNLTSVGSPYPTTGVSTTESQNGTQPTVSPLVTAPTAGVMPRQGPYDPNGYAAAHVAQAPPAVAAIMPSSPLPFESTTGLAQGLPPGIPALPAPVYLSPANPLPSHGVAAIPPSVDPSVFNTQDNALRNPSPPYTTLVPPPASVPIAANTPPSPYRPGGTSDYPGSQASYSIAKRTQPVVNNPVPLSPPTVPQPTVNP